MAFSGACSMSLLLAKFRIPVSDVVLISDITLPPSTSTKTWFDNLTKEYVRNDIRDGQAVNPGEDIRIPLSHTHTHRKEK